MCVAFASLLFRNDDDEDGGIEWEWIVAHTTKRERSLIRDAKYWWSILPLYIYIQPEYVFFLDEKTHSLFITIFSNIFTTRDDDSHPCEDATRLPLYVARQPLIACVVSS